MGGSEAFGGWLSAAMRSRGLSQAQVARMVGVADAQVSRWRRGQVVATVRHLQRVADAFGVARGELEPFAGYAPADPDGVDPAAQAELQSYQIWFGRLLVERLPRPLWRAYSEACEALAGSLVASFELAVRQARAEV